MRVGTGGRLRRGWEHEEGCGEGGGGGMRVGTGVRVGTGSVDRGIEEGERWNCAKTEGGNVIIIIILYFPPAVQCDRLAIEHS